MRILVIDDDAVLGRSLARLLRRKTVVVETDPTRALASIVVDGADFDLILCDLHIPRMQGTEVLDAVRSHFGAGAPLLVLMTGSDDPVAGSADAILTKPFDQTALRGIVALAKKKRGLVTTNRMTPLVR